LNVSVTLSAEVIAFVTTVQARKTTLPPGVVRWITVQVLPRGSVTLLSVAAALAAIPVTTRQFPTGTAAAVCAACVLSPMPSSWPCDGEEQTAHQAAPKGRRG
jgi:hypothetical protein